METFKELQPIINREAYLDFVAIMVKKGDMQTEEDLEFVEDAFFYRINGV